MIPEGKSANSGYYQKTYKGFEILVVGMEYRCRRTSACNVDKSLKSLDVLPKDSKAAYAL